MYHKQQITRARSLRRNQTEAEKKLWYHLRSTPFNAFKFRRQVPIGPYIVDFLSYKSNLVIELDGGQHYENRNYDAKRTLMLNGRGYTVIRFWNNDVMGNIDGVLETIMKVLN